MKSLLFDKEIRCILPLFEKIENIADFKKKAELFNSFFANQCSLINNNSQFSPTFLTKHTKGYPQSKLQMIKYLK